MSTNAASSPLLDRARIRALLVGGFIGCIAWALLARPGAGSYQLAMAVIVIGAGGASFVAFALHQQGSTWRQGAARTRAWVCAMGCGVSLAMSGIQWFVG